MESLNQRPVGLIDVMPSLLRVAGMEKIPPSLQGKSFSAALEGKSIPEFEYSFGKACSHRGHKNDPSYVQSRENKFIQIGPKGRAEFYDRLKDPREIKNISSVAGLKNSLNKIFLNHRDGLKKIIPLDREERSLPNDVKENLRSLGYLK